MNTVTNHSTHDPHDHEQLRQQVDRQAASAFRDHGPASMEHTAACLNLVLVEVLVQLASARLERNAQALQLENLLASVDESLQRMAETLIRDGEAGRAPFGAAAV
jgi:hypothetical protein